MNVSIKKAAAGAAAVMISAAFAAGTVLAGESFDKTVYVITDAEGTVTQVIDMDQEETAEAAELPVEIRASYELDGQSISPEDLAGQSGHVTIRMEYDNHTDAPFAVLTGMLLDDEVFSNVELTNGKLLGDGSRMIAVGIAFPGLQDSLDLEEDTLDIPEEFIIDADVEDFELEMVYSIALSNLLGDLDESKLVGLDDLTDSVQELTDAMEELTAGAQELTDGTGSLRDGLEEIASHNAELTDGAEQVFEALLATVQEQAEAAGLPVETLTPDNYRDVLERFDDAWVTEQAEEQVAEQVDAMGDALYLTYLQSQQDDIIETYLQSQQDDIIETYLQSQQDNLISAYLQQNAEDIYRSYMLSQIPEDQAAMLPEDQLAAMVAGQLEALSDEEKAQILEGAKLQITDEQVAQILEGAKLQITDEQVVQILEGAKLQISDEQVTQILEGALQTLTQDQKDQIREGAISQAMESDEVKAQIESARSQLTTLQSATLQLDRYQAFYNGLVEYTDGVQTAADGAADLDDGAVKLKDGLDQFDEEGIQKIADAVNDQLQPLLDHIREVLDQDREYHYQDDTEGTVKFIYKMESISGTSE